MLFNELGLRAELVEAVKAKGYTEPSQIQAKAIPSILEGRDLLGGAQTGTGKTAAFTLPLLQLLAERRAPEQGDSRNGRRRRHLPRALVITPTRELAAQIGESVISYGEGLNLSSTVIFGGVGINPQISRLRRGVDILVATPGRLLDHAGQGTVDLSQIEILVLDEADRMLDMGFIHDIRKILKLLPARRQNLLFSATYSDEIKKLSEGILHDPVFVEVARRNTAAEKVEQVVHPVAKNDKRHLLAQLINDNDWQQVLVFNRTKHGSNRLAKQLAEGGISATAIHGNKSQGARTKALADFKSGRVRVLVATDVASRGIDINRLPHVVNFDLPNVPEDYVHRIGRTGRAGEEGAAHSLVSADERGLLRDIERLLKREIPVEKIEGFEMNEADVKEAAEKKRNSRGGGGGGGRRSSGGGFSRGRNGGGGGGRPSGSGNRRNSSRRRSSGSRSAA
ncbi:MAG: DEAD/DEAH box helicase [Verrucomicrobiales bacterium]|nr:DEAD/DEAH box helicase [Verrucomicrobiales bacterium]